MAGTLVERAPPGRGVSGDGARLARTLGWVALAILAPVALLTSLIHGLPAGLLAPLLGPWAGLAVGHHDCTMAAVWPEVTWALVACGVLLALSIGLLRRPLLRAFAPLLVSSWLLAWCWTALLSLINTAS